MKMISERFMSKTCYSCVREPTLTQGDFGQMQAIDPGDFANWTGRT